jgi:hypothetical protein
MRKILMAAAAAALMAMPANAVIVSGVLTGGDMLTAGGVFQVTTLSNITVNTINSKNVIGINEQQNYTLTSALRVFNINVTAPATPSGTTGSILIASGTKVSSHLIFMDPTDSAPASGGGGNTVYGTVTFNAPILGYIYATTQRGGANFPTTNYLGATGTSYGNLHGTLETVIDSLSFSGKTLTYAMTSSRDVGDYVRVITEDADPVPEPETWAMLLAGFGLVGGVARRRSSVGSV